MRRIPTTSLRSTLLALLLTLCLALPALAAQKEGLLLVAFGTSVPEAQPALTAIDKEFKAAFPHSPVIWAYTSSIIRAKLEKKGVHIGDVAAGLEELARQKVDVVRVQSLHVVAGEEFSEMERLLVSWLVRHPDSFKAVYLGRPLLESRQDAEDVCRAVLGATEGKRKSGELLALMGHGQSHGRGDMIIEGMRATLADADNLAVLATVEGSRPAARPSSGSSPSWWWPGTTPATTWPVTSPIPGPRKSAPWALPPAPYSPVWASCPACAPSSCAMPATAKTIC